MRGSGSFSNLVLMIPILTVLLVKWSHMRHLMRKEPSSPNITSTCSVSIFKVLQTMEDGIFVDNAVTKAPFVGGYRQTKLIVYRRCTQSNANDLEFCPAEEINDVMDTAIQTLESGGFRVVEDTPKKFFSWLLDFFNPDPEMGKKDFHRIYDDILAREADGELPIGDSLCNSLVMSPPRSDNKNNCWWFDDKPVRFMRIGGLRNIPRIGQLTGEVVDGELGSGSETVSCGLDRLLNGLYIVFNNSNLPTSRI